MIFILDFPSRLFKSRFQRTPKIEVWLEEENVLSDFDNSVEAYELESVKERVSSPEGEEKENESIGSENNDSEDESDEDEPLSSFSTQEYGQTTSHFIGKNGFLWSKSKFKRSSSIPAHNVEHVSRPSEQPTFRNPIDLWAKLFDTDMVEKVVAHTNKKLRGHLAQNRNSNKTELKETDGTEIRSLLGLLYYSAVFKCNHTDAINLFATDGTAYEIFRIVMPKIRFLTLLNCLRFDSGVDRQERLETDPLAAVSFIFETFFTNCQNNYTLGPNTCVDEMLISFRGKSFFTSISTKQKKNGIKIMILSDGEKPYAYNAYIYCGNSDSEGLSEVERKLEVPAQSVIRLTKPIADTNRNVTANNRFSSIQLMEILYSKNLTYLGSLKRKYREIPLEFQPNKRRELGSSLYGFTKDYTIVSYVPEINKAEIVISSSHHEPSTDEATNKPTMIVDYINRRAGFKELAQQCSLYSCSRRTGRWSMAIFYRILDLAGVNAYVLYQGCLGPKLKRRDFLLSLARNLILPSLKDRVYNSKLPRELRLTIRRVLGKDLLPAPLQPPEPGQERKRRLCSVCPSRLKRQTRYSCCACYKAICLQCSANICNDCK